MTHPLVLLRAPCCGSLLERAYVAQALAMEKHGGHEDLRGSGRRNVIPYIHGRVCCIAVCARAVQAMSLTCLNLTPAPPFVAQGCGSYKGSLGPDRCPEWLGPIR
jgi:hypothetical protein